MKISPWFALPLFALLAACSGSADIEGDLPEPLAEDDGDYKLGVLLEDGLPEVAYLDVNEGAVIEGDILVPRDAIRPAGEKTELGTTQSALTSLRRGALWPNATVPYQFDDSVSAEMKDKVRKAMAVWEAGTPVRFVPRKGQADFVHISMWNGNYSYASVGHRGGRQNLVIQRSALSGSWGKGLIEHELGHAFGLMHEQTRSDRDEFVTIHWDNIRDGMKSNFRKFDGGLLPTTYNVRSIMHYGSFIFSKNGKPTITRKDGSTFATNWSGPTARDLEGVTAIYTR